jgi:ribokinase
MNARKLGSQSPAMSPAHNLPNGRRVFNLGSINVDHSYAVERFVAPGETLAATSYVRGAGGKGFNQSIALARAGAAVRHVGAVGPDGTWLQDRLAAEGVDVSAVRNAGEPTGHAIIQVTPAGENCILLHGGANLALRRDDVIEALRDARPGDRFLSQNETALIPEALHLARERGLEVWFNPAPISAAVNRDSLMCVDWLILNEAEGAELSGKTSPPEIVGALSALAPDRHIVLTLGAKGVFYRQGARLHSVPSPSVRAIDATAAGDTFIGYLVAATGAGLGIPEALVRAAAAAALSVTCRGAAESIPTAAEVNAFSNSEIRTA